MANFDSTKIRGPRKDITGQKYGRLSVVSFAGNSFWNCKCECGNETVVRGPHLKRGRIRSCGCYKRDEASSRLSAKLAGQKFGRLSVVERSGTSNRYNSVWLCQCDCGNTTKVAATRLIQGTTQSCGCLQKERTTTHGRSRTRTYRIWTHMRQRCENPNNDGYFRYGGRGITVSPEWSDFERFLADMGDAPRAHSIERKDNNGNYSKENCRWATSKEQVNNTSRNKVVMLNGEMVPLTQAIAILREAAVKKAPYTM